MTCSDIIIFDSKYLDRRRFDNGGVFFAITDFFELSLLNPSFDKSFLKSSFDS